MKLPKTWLIVGGTGQLGSVLCTYLRSLDCIVISSSSRTLFSAESGIQNCSVDFLSDDQALTRLASYAPDAVINCMATTAIDDSLAKSKVHRLNVEIPELLAALARQMRIPFVHISTDSVYDMASPTDLADESSEVLPLNDYAHSKLASERAVMAEYSHGVVLRTNFFGWNPVPGRGLAEWIITKLTSGQEFTGFEDVMFSPVYTETLAELIVQAICCELQGVFNVGGGSCLSKYDFACMLAERLELPIGGIHRGERDSSLPATVARPRNTCLDSTRFYRAIGSSPRDIEAEIDRFAASCVGEKLKHLVRPQS